MSEPSKFGQRVEAYMRLAGLNHSSLARKAGVSRVTLLKIIHGRQKTTSIQIAAKLAKALGVSLDTLVGDVLEEELAAAGV